jgi:hypothetical protein
MTATSDLPADGSFRIREPRWIAFAVVTAALLAVEAAFFLGEFNPARRYAAIFWIAASVTVVASTWAFALAWLFDPVFWRQPGKAWFLLAFFLPPALVYFDGGGIRFSQIDAEGLQQLASGIYLMHNDPSLGVFRMSYFTYLARQYVLMCLPSYFLGPSLWAARIGSTMFFVGSYLFFLSSLATYLKRIRMPDPLFFTGLCGTLVSLGFYVMMNARKFEQTTMPIAITLFFTAALLLYLSKPGVVNLVWLTWGFGFFPECYTPALGSWGLALVVLLYLVLWKRRTLLIPAITYGCVTLWTAYLTVAREDQATFGLKFKLGVDHFTRSDWIHRYLDGARSVIGADFALIPAPLALGIFAAIYLAWRYREYRFGAICAWSVAVYYVSLTFVGSNLNFPNHDIHRGMIMIPPLTVGMILLVARYLSEPSTPEPALRLVKFFSAVSMVYMAVTCIGTVVMVRNFFAMNTVNDYDEAFAKINEIVHTPGIPYMSRVYLVPPLEIDLETGLEYFAPDVVVVRKAPPAGEHVKGYWVFSYLKSNADDRFEDEVVPSRHPRPFLKMVPEY